MVISPDQIQKLTVSERLALIEALWKGIADAPDSPGGQGVQHP